MFDSNRMKKILASLYATLSAVLRVTIVDLRRDGARWMLAEKLLSAPVDWLVWLQLAKLISKDVPGSR